MTATARIDWARTAQQLAEITPSSAHYCGAWVAAQIAPALPAPPRPDVQAHLLPDDLARPLLAALVWGGAQAGVLARLAELPGATAIWVQDSRATPHQCAWALLQAAVRGGAPAVAAALALPCPPD